MRRLYATRGYEGTGTDAVYLGDHDQKKRAHDAGTNWVNGRLEATAYYTVTKKWMKWPLDPKPQTEAPECGSCDHP